MSAGRGVAPLSVLLLLLSACRAHPVRDVAGQLPPLVEEYVCRYELMRNEISTFGTVSYLNKADVVPMSSETIRELYFEEGDTVYKGEVLALLDTRKLDLQMEELEAGIETKRAALLLAEEKLAESRRNMETRFYRILNAGLDLEQKKADYVRVLGVLENKKQLFQAGGIPQEELLSVELTVREKETSYRQAEYILKTEEVGFREEDLIRGGYEPSRDEEERKTMFIELNTRVPSAEAELARSEWLAARSRIETLELYREESRIKAPISGIIGRKYMDAGEKTLENQPLYMIYPTEQVCIIARMGEKDLNTVKAGQQVLVSRDYDDSEFTGQIQRISPWIQKESRSGEVRVLLENDKGRFRIGQFVRLKIQLEDPAEQLMIPSSSLKGGDEAWVFVIRQNRLFQKAVTPGRECGDRTSVLAGLSEGDRIVSGPPDFLRNGMEVRIR